MTRRVWTDQDYLECLDLIERQRVSFERAAEIMGCKRSQMVGIISRLRRAIKDSDPTGHLNGTMPERWWARP